MELTYFLAQLFGYYLVIIGLLFLFRKNEFIRVVSDMSKSESFLLLAGMLTAAAGLATVLTHNLWSEGNLALLVTLIGWAALLKGLALMFLPERTIVMWTRWSSLKKYSYFYAIVILLLGLYLLHGGITRVGLLG